MRFLKRLMEIKEEQLFLERSRNMMIAGLVEGLVKDKEIKKEVWGNIERIEKEERWKK